MIEGLLAKSPSTYAEISKKRSGRVALSKSA
jgi:hypothetical protein